MSTKNEDRTARRGFASMDRIRQKEIARMGGRASHEKGKAHQFTPEEARVAGRKGGETISQNRQHMAEIGRRGGMRRGQTTSHRATHPDNPQNAE